VIHIFRWTGKPLIIKELEYKKEGSASKPTRLKCVYSVKDYCFSHVVLRPSRGLGNVHKNI